MGFAGALVVLELSLAIVLLSGAGVCLQTLLQLYNAPLAVGIENRLVIRLPLSAQRYPTADRRSVFIGHVLERIGTVPGILSASINAGIHPLGSWNFPIEIPGVPQADPRPVNLHQVDAAYLRTTGIGLRLGRWLTVDDVTARRRVAVVNEAFVKRYFGGQSPLGRHVGMPRLKMPPFGLPDATFEIAGVAQNALHELHNAEASAEVYVPYSITGLADSIVVHTRGDPLRLAKPIQGQIYELDGSQFVDETQTLVSLMDRWVYSRGRFHLWLMGSFAAVGLTLAAIGIYGVMAQIAAQQRREFGIRIAIGAQFTDILFLVLTKGLLLIAAGLAAGVGVTLLLLRQFGGELGVTNPYDPASLAGSCTVLFAAGLAACLIPAIRAGRLNPMDILRPE